MTESVVFNEAKIKRFMEKKSDLKFYSFCKTKHLNENTIQIQL